MMGALDDFLDETTANQPPTTAALQPKPVATIAAQPTEPPKPDPIDAFLSQDDIPALQYGVEQGSTKDSGQATRVLKAIGATGLPRDFVERNLDFVEQETAKQGFDPAQFIKTNPTVSEYLKDPLRAAAVKEDLSRLSFIEKQLRFIPAKVDQGVLTNELGTIGMAALAGEITPEQRKRQAEIEPRLNDIQNMHEQMDMGLLSRIPGETAYTASQMLSSVPDILKGATGTLTAGAAAGAAAAATTGNPALIPAGAALGLGWSLAGGFVYSSAKMEAGTAYLEYEKLKDENGNPLDKATITGLALMVGAINGPLDGLTGPEALTSDTLKRGVKGQIRSLLSSPTARAALLGYAKTIGTTAATEGVTEFLQSLVTRAGGETAKAIQNGASALDVIEKTFSPEGLSQAFSEGTQAVLGAGGFSTVVASPALVEDLRQAKIAKSNEQTWKNIGDAVKATKMAEALPDHLQAIVAKAVEGKMGETVYMPVEPFKEYFQSKGIDPREAAQAITGNVEAYDQAVQTGQDLSIKTADYATKVAPTEHNAFFAHELRTAVDQMNAREAEEWQKEMDAQAQAEAQQTGLNVASATDQAAKIKKEIAGQLQAIGFDPTIAEQYAALYESRYRTRAERRGLGEDPAALFEKLNLSVRRHVSDILKTLGGKTTELDAMLDRLRKGEVPKESEVFGQSLTAFLREKGGLQDQGGELSNRNVDTARKPFQKKLVQKKGQTLDRAAELAAEAGFIPERNIAALLEAIDKESRGQPVYAAGKENSRALDLYYNLESLRKYLDDRNIDLAKVSNEEIKKQLGEAVQQTLPAVEGQTFAQDGRKGSITFGDTQTIITLFDGADLSTVLHESGHLYLNELIDDATTEGTSQQIKDDLDAILQWMGLDVRVANGAEAVKAAVQTEQHEKWARGFELYLMEGKAPSQTLRESFSRFRQWLSHVYRIFKTALTGEKALNVTLNDDVRQVFDRMLATDAEIDAAAAEAEVLPLFTDAAQAGMSEAQWKNYQETVAKASVDARETLQAKLMAQYQRQRETWWKERREEVKKAVTDEVNNTPVYEALAVLQTGKLPDGSDIPEGITVAKLDKKAIVDTLGKDFLKRMPKGITTTKEGIHFDTAAQVWGYNTGTEFLEALVNARPKKQLIEAETDARMRAEYGDLLTDGTIADQARAAVLNEFQEKVIEAEIKALNAKRRQVEPFVKQAVSEAVAQEQADRAMEVGALKGKAAFEKEARKGAMSSLMPPIETVRDTAKQQVDKTTIRKLQPSTYFVFSQKAARESVQAIAKEDYVAASLWKQKELLNLALYREATKAQERADHIAERMQGLEKQAAQERIGKAGGDYLEQLNGILERFEFTKVSNKRLDSRQSLAEWIKEKEAAGETLGEEFVVPDSILNESKRVNYRDLTREELEGVYETVKQIEHFAKLKNKLLKQQKIREKDEARTALIAAVEEHVRDRGPLPLTKAELTKVEKMSRMAQRWDASLLRMEQVIEWMDGGATGPWHDLLWNPAVDAQAEEYDKTAVVTAKVAAAVNSMPKQIREHTLDLVQVSGIERPVTRKTLIGVALNLGNESNYTKLMKGMNWRPEQVKAMADLLTAEEIAFVNKVHATLESLWPEIAAMQKRLTGLEPVKIEPKPFEAANGTIAGGYYPVMYSAAGSQQGNLQLSSTIGGLIEDQYTRATLPSGYRKARVEGFARPFDLDLDRLPNHIAGVIKDLTHREWLMDANWITNDPEILKALNRRLGEPMTARLREWVRQVVNDRNSYSSGSLSILKQPFEALRFNAMIVSMGFKASTMISQLAGVAPAIEVIGGNEHDGAKWFAKGALEVLRRPRSAYEYMTALSGEMRHRMETRDRDLRDNLRRLEGRTDLRAQIQEVSMLAIGYTEMMISMPSWYGAFYKALAAGSSKEEAVRMGDRAVRLGQGSAGAKDLAAVANRSDMLWRLLTMYYTPFSALYGRLRDIGHSFGSVKDLPGISFRLFWVVIVASTLGELASGHGPDEKKDESWLAWWLKAMAVYPFLSVPLVRDVANEITQGYGYQFTPLAQAIKAPIAAVQSGAKVAAGEKDMADFAEKSFKAMSYMLGLPTGQLQITGSYLYDLANGKAHPDNIFEFGKWFLYKRTKEEKEQ